MLFRSLRTYWDLHTQQRATGGDYDGWIPRISQVPDVEAAKLSSVHGRLIAFGFLKFDLSDRDIGMRYQLTPLAKQAIGAGEVGAGEVAEAVEFAESA